MKRIMIATALTTTLATSAFALSEGQMNELETFAPAINFDAMSESQLDVAYGIVSSGDSRSMKLTKLESLALDDRSADASMLTEAEMNRLAQYAPGADLTGITQAQAQAALAITYGGASEGAKSERVQNILNDATVMNDMSMEIAAGQQAMIESYVPGIDFSTLTDEDVQLIVTYIHSGMSRSDTVSQIEALIQG